MNRSFSLRSQMFGLMALLVLLQSLALVCSLVISRVFFMLDAEAFRVFESTAAMRAQTYNTSIGSLVATMADETETLSNELFALAQTQDEMDIMALYADSETYTQAATTGTQRLLSLLQNTEVSGAFFMLEGSVATGVEGDTHSAVYLRNTAAGSGVSSARSYQLEIGPIAVSQQHQIPASINWRLDLTLDTHGEAAAAYFDAPIQAANDDPRAEVERLGFWMKPTDILGDRQQVVTYTMPLRTPAGEPFGVMGVEISLSLFTQYYLPNTDLPYSNSFYAIASIAEDEISLDWLIPSGPLAQVYLQQGNHLPVKSVPSTTLYQTEMEGLGTMYCSIQPLTMYSRNSPFASENWSLIGFVPSVILHESSTSVREILIFSIVLTTVISFLAIFLIVFITTRKISGLSKYTRELSPYEEIKFTRTGIREVDELTDALEKVNKSVRNASKTTSKILELTLLPIGGYEITVESSYVILTEYIYKLLDLPQGTHLSRQEWEGVFSRLVDAPAPGYDDIYCYLDHTGDEKWLRIIETETETGKVGVVLDVSRDVEEQRRLAHELDYDALTHLYSRTAFKRESFRLIQGSPGKTGAMIFIDLDNLKYTNDTFGHDMGDRLIIRGSEMFRQFEAFGGVVSRISGDEFAVFLHGYDSKEDIRKVYQDLFLKNADYTLLTPDGQAQKIRFSAGVAYYPEDSDNVTDLLKLSDYAMYEAKHNQKGTVFEFNRESYRENIYLLENREAINLLLDEGLIRFAFQPIVDIRTGEVFAYEALMRPLLDNFKSPLEILTVAAAQSKLGQLEHLVMTTAFQAVQDRIAVLGERKMFINSIPSQMLSEEDQLRLERNYPHLFGQIVIEITEEEKESPEQMECKTAFIRRTGMALALDDFGSGYSNEGRILSMAPDILKVDIELISNIDTDPDKQLLLRNLISFCQPKGIRMVAEGVERREELAELIRLGVDFVQGYYLGRPAFDLQPIDEKMRKEILYLQGQKE